MYKKSFAFLMIILLSFVIILIRASSINGTLERYNENNVSLLGANVEAYIKDTFKYIEDTVEEFYFSDIYDLKLIDLERVKKEGLTDENCLINKEKLSQMLLRYMHHIDGAVNVYVQLEDGESCIVSSKYIYEYFNIVDSQIYNNAKYDTKVNFSIIKSNDERNNMMCVSKSIFNYNEEFLGIIAVDIDLENINDTLLSSLPYFKDYDLIIYDLIGEEIYNSSLEVEINDIESIEEQSDNKLRKEKEKDEIEKKEKVEEKEKIKKEKNKSNNDALHVDYPNFSAKPIKYRVTNENEEYKNFESSKIVKVKDIFLDEYSLRFSIMHNQDSLNEELFHLNLASLFREIAIFILIITLLKVMSKEKKYVIISCILVAYTSILLFTTYLRVNKKRNEYVDSTVKIFTSFYNLKMAEKDYRCKSTLATSVIELNSMPYEGDDYLLHMRKFQNKVKIAHESLIAYGNIKDGVVAYDKGYVFPDEWKALIQEYYYKYVDVPNISVDVLSKEESLYIYFFPVHIWGDLNHEGVNSNSKYAKGMVFYILKRDTFNEHVARLSSGIVCDLLYADAIDNTIRIYEDKKLVSSVNITDDMLKSDMYYQKLKIKCKARDTNENGIYEMQGSKDIYGDTIEDDSHYLIVKKNAISGEYEPCIIHIPSEKNIVIKVYRYIMNVSVWIILYFFYRMIRTRRRDRNQNNNDRKTLYTRLANISESINGIKTNRRFEDIELSLKREREKKIDRDYDEW